MDSKFYVSLKVAKLLKEKGYRQKYHAYYFGNSNLRKGGYRGDSWYDSPDFYPAPTISEVIDWLDRKIHIGIGYDDLHSKWHYDMTPVRPGTKAINNLSFSTRLEAEEAAIIDALEEL